MKITFCGAAKIVTGSCFLVEANNQKILVDCGMFQGSKETTRLNYLPFPFNPEEISFLFLTHAHIDHSGLIPKLVKQGFKGKIFATSATVDLTKALLEDSASIQESDTEHENRRRLRVGLPARESLYKKEDVINTFPFFHRVDYEKKYKINDFIEARFNDAGHILGSAIIELWISEKTEHDNYEDDSDDENEKLPYFGGPVRKIVFSGDLGQWDIPIVRDPSLIKEADYVIVESTYGNRLHEDKDTRDQKLLEICKETYKKGGKVLIPTFAVERTQELLYSFYTLVKQNKFPSDMKIFLDSPLAIRVTDIFQLHKDCYDKETFAKSKDIFNFKNFEYSKTTRDSVRLNDYTRPCVIMAGNGMCTGGRIRHHLKYGIWDKKNTLVFVGYQADSTLGRYLLNGADKIRMMGEEFVVKAKIEKIDGFSAHADKNELMRWMNGFENHPRKVFIVHGEPDSQAEFKKNLQKNKFDAEIPEMGQSFLI